jgi:predicted DNA-binding transcriptional regulator AlpA
LGPSDAAALIGLGRSVFYAWDRRGLVPAPVVRRGRVVRWSRAELEAWVAAGMPPRLQWSARREQPIKTAALTRRNVG